MTNLRLTQAQLQQARQRIRGRRSRQKQSALGKRGYNRNGPRSTPAATAEKTGAGWLAGIGDEEWSSVWRPRYNDAPTQAGDCGRGRPSARPSGYCHSNKWSSDGPRIILFATVAVSQLISSRFTAASISLAIRFFSFLKQRDTYSTTCAGRTGAGVAFGGALGVCLG